MSFETRAERRAGRIVWLSVASAWVMAAACASHNNIGTQTTGGTGGTAAASGGAGGGATAAAGGGGTIPAGTGGTPGSASGGGGSTGAAGAAASGGAGSSGGIPAADVGPAFFITGCRLWPDVAVPPPSEIHLGTDGLIRADQHDCAFTASTPVPLPLQSLDGANLLFHYDLNGDGVDDLFFGDPSSSGAGGGRHALVALVSTLKARASGTGKDLSFTRAVCMDTGTANPYRLFYLRDLNRDGVPDFVVATGTTIDAWLNLDGKQRGVLHYDFPNPHGDAWAALLDVLVGDFDDDGTDDVVMGYDSNQGISTPNIEIGALFFRGRSGRGTYDAPTTVSSYRPPMSSTPLGGAPSGYLAAVPAQPPGNPTAVFGLTWSDPSAVGWLFHGQGLTIVPAGYRPGDEAAFVQSTGSGATSALLVGTTDGIALYDLNSQPSKLLLTHPTSFKHSYDRELGGGPRMRTYYLLDVDSDGDDDLVEYDRMASHQLAIHAQHGSVAFGDPALVDLGADYSTWLAESPLVAVGAMRGRLVVSDGVVNSLATSPATVRALLCPN